MTMFLHFQIIYRLFKISLQNATIFSSSGASMPQIAHENRFLVGSNHDQLVTPKTIIKMVQTASLHRHAGIRAGV